MADMVFCYRLVNGSDRQAHVMYAKRHPECNIPSEKMFSRLFQKPADMGSFTARTMDCSRSRTVCTPDIEERVLGHVEHDPETSVHRIAAAEGINHSLAWSITTVHTPVLLLPIISFWCSV